MDITNWQDLEGAALALIPLETLRSPRRKLLGFVMSYMRAGPED
jgi:hypothetical protein